MKREINKILEESKRAPSVLNSQPWRFKVYGNTIEIYLDKQSELEEIDPRNRLQIASCGSLISYITNAVEKKGWSSKVSYFPRFEEENLVAFIEVKDIKNNIALNSDVATADEPQGGQRYFIEELQEIISIIAARKDAGIIVHDDRAERKLHSYFLEKCGKILENEIFQQNLNMFLRSGTSMAEECYEDEILLSDQFFQSGQEAARSSESVAPGEDIFLILVTGSDNRYAWARSGEVLAESLLQIKKKGPIGLMALPITCKEPCRDWLRKELNIKEYPQFVLKTGLIKQKEHIRKRPLQDLLKYGF